MWTVNWIGLIGVYVFMAYVMLVEVQGIFGYIMGAVCIPIIFLLLYWWINQSTEPYTPVKREKKKSRGKYSKYYR